MQPKGNKRQGIVLKRKMANITYDESNSFVVFLIGTYKGLYFVKKLHLNRRLRFEKIKRINKI